MMIALLFTFFVACTCAPAKTSAVWIDTDPSIGAVYREVDDAFALVLAFHSPELRIAGLSTTYGNAGLGRTTKVGRELVRYFGAPANLAENHIFAGAASPRELGRRTPASDGFARAAQRERLTYVALGPLTNLASFLQLHPNLADRIEKVIFAGGKSPGYSLAFGPNEWLRIHDANVFKDPAAVRTVLQFDLPITLVPVETSCRLSLDQPNLRTLSASGPAGEFLSRRSRVWCWFWTGIVREKGAPLFDALAVLLAAQPRMVETEKRYASVDQTGNLLASKRPISNTRPVQFCTAFRAEAKEFVLSRLQRRPAARDTSERCQSSSP